MIRTVIAEDESPLLRGLAKMIERADKSFVPVCLAKNGKEALEYLSQHEADVLFTDINMPLVNGIKLMEQIRHMNPRMPMVVISGYDDFEYARQALRLGAVNYLLKPIAREELEKLLAELKSILEKNAHAQKREALIQALFGGNERALKAVDLKPLSVFYLCLGAYQHEAGGEELQIPGGLSDQEMLKILGKKKAGENLWLFFGNKSNEAIWIFEGEAEADLEQLQDAVRSRFRNDYPLTVALERNVRAEQLLKTVTELEEWLRCGVKPGASRLIQKRPDCELPSLSLSDKSLLRLYLQRRDWTSFQETVQALWEKRPDELGTQRVLEALLTDVLEIVQEENGETAFEAKPEVQVREFFELSDGAEDVIAACTSYCRSVLKNDEAEALSNEQLMQELDHYMQEHLIEPLSLKDLSRRFGLVAPYLSKLFKAYKGLSPTEYIRELRLKNAKAMLRENPSLLVKDIAANLGYQNPLYFSRIFKKHVGVYPSDYRNAYAQGKKEKQDMDGLGEKEKLS